MNEDRKDYKTMVTTHVVMDRVAAGVTISSHHRAVGWGEAQEATEVEAITNATRHAFEDMERRKARAVCPRCKQARVELVAGLPDLCGACKIAVSNSKGE